MSNYKNKIPLYKTMPTLNGLRKANDGTNVKIPSIEDVEQLKNFSVEHKL